MTTFTSLDTVHAGISGSGTLGFTPVSSARLAGTGALSPSLSLISGGGVILRGGSVTLSGLGVLSASLRNRRPVSASIAGVGSLRLGEGAYATLPALTGLSADRAYGSASGSLPAMTGEAHDPLLVPAFGNATSTLPALVGAASGLTGTITVGTTPAVLPALVGQASNRPYAASSTSLQPLIGFSSEGPGAGFAFVGDTVFAFDDIGAEQDINAKLLEQLDLISTMALERLLDAGLLESLTITPALSALAELGEEMTESVRVVSGYTPDGAFVAWVVNTTAYDQRLGRQLYPSSMYDNFDFNSLGRFKGRYFGARSDGIYELVGDTDHGTAIKASVLLGKDDYKDPHVKKMQYVYADMKASAALSVTATIDDAEQYTYALPATTSMKNSRAVLGRGLRARHWQLLITNPGGGDFTINSVETMAEATTRRLK